MLRIQKEKKKRLSFQVLPRSWALCFERTTIAAFFFFLSLPAVPRQHDEESHKKKSERCEPRTRALWVVFVSSSWYYDSIVSSFLLSCFLYSKHQTDVRKMKAQENKRENPGKKRGIGNGMQSSCRLGYLFLLGVSSWVSLLSLKAQWTSS